MLCPRSRREFLAAPAPGLAAALLSAQVRAERWRLASADDQLLEDLSRRCFFYFWEQSDPHSGIARDRARADGRLYHSDGRYIGSTGATGFALTALCIAAERGWISRRAARSRPGRMRQASWPTPMVGSIISWIFARARGTGPVKFPRAIPPGWSPAH